MIKFQQNQQMNAIRKIEEAINEKFDQLVKSIEEIAKTIDKKIGIVSQKIEKEGKLNKVLLNEQRNKNVNGIGKELVGESVKYSFRPKKRSSFEEQNSGKFNTREPNIDHVSNGFTKNGENR